VSDPTYRFRGRRCVTPSQVAAPRWRWCTARRLPENWTLAGQFAAYWPTVESTRDLTAEATVLLDRQLTGPWDAFLEYAADFPRRGGTRQLLHLGTAYKLSARQQIDLHAAVGLSDAAARSYLGLGYSCLFLTP
jgi:hypothetical protein